MRDIVPAALSARLAALTVTFERLSGREQIMSLFLVCAVLGMAVGWTTYFVNKDLTNRELRLADKTKKLGELMTLRSDYQRRLADQKRIADQIRKNNTVRLLSYIEDVSAKANIELGNAAERSGEPTGSELLKEEAAEVTIRKVSMDRLYKFMSEIERTNQLVKIRRLKIKTRFDDPKMLDATVTIGTLKTTDG